MTILRPTGPAATAWIEFSVTSADFALFAVTQYACDPVGTSSSQKMCVICGENCAGRPRLRDDRGRYACKDCADRKKRVHPRPKAPPVPVVEPENYELQLDDIKQPEAVGEMCMGCGVRMPAGAVVCMRCGVNSQTGVSSATNVKINKPKLARATTPQIGIGAAASGVGALLGLGLWLAVGAMTGRPSFMMATAVGLFAGIGMLIPIRGSGRAITGLIACGCAMAVSGVGIAIRTPDGEPETFMYPSYVLSARGYIEIERRVENLGTDEYLITGSVWLALGCCAAFAFGGSNPDPDADGADE